jgi:hypothetical protein
MASQKQSLTIRDHAGQLIKLRIRVIEATGKHSSSNEVVVDNESRDLETALRALPFANYQIIDNQAIEMAARQRQVIEIANADTLGVRLQYLTPNKIGIWLNWHDSTGVELLNTRMHITKDMPVVVGADAPEGQALKARILVVTIG